jgi:hypothetical protein
VKEGLKIAKERGKIYKHKPIDDLLENKELLLREYETQSLTEISIKYHAQRKRLARACKKFNIPIKDWSEKVHRIQSQVRESRLPQEILDPVWLRGEYIDKVRGIDDIASSTGCSITAVRNRLKRFNIPIRPQKKFGHEKESSKRTRGINVIYKPIKCTKTEVMFRSVLECAYAIYLDSLEQVKSWDYEVITLRYLDSYSGRNRLYYCDFVVYYENKMENIEVKPLNLQTFEDKYLCAQYQLENWRWISKQEIEESNKLFSIPNNRVIFPEIFYKNKKKFVMWSKNKIQVPAGYKILSKHKRYGHILKYRIINDNLIIDRPIIIHYDRPRLVTQGGVIILNLDEILNLIRNGLKKYEIQKKYGVCGNTITKFLEDRSYVVSWGGSSSKHNEIRYATKLIWPLEELPPRQVVRNKSNHEWDNKDWLYQKYIVEKLATRPLGKLVGVSGRLILKKLRKYNIETRSLNKGNG